jgi:hypothetical protein
VSHPPWHAAGARLGLELEIVNTTSQSLEGFSVQIAAFDRVATQVTEARWNQPAVQVASGVLILPVLMSDYYVGEATWVFIYGICGVSLMVLVGYTVTCVPISTTRSVGSWK